MKLLISFATYPRRGRITYESLQKTFDSLIKQDTLDTITFEFIVVGDDYPNIKELCPIFDGYPVQFYNINQHTALRDEPISKHVRWAQAVQRSKIFILEKALTMDYDYILMSSDDDTYLHRKITTSISYIMKHNQPDFVFCAGTHCVDTNSTPIVLPSTPCPYPEPENCIASGCMYKLRNQAFIQDIIRYRKQRWIDVEMYIHACKNNHLDYMRSLEKRIKPEDFQLWFYLLPLFQRNIYSCVFIPTIHVHHGPERTLFQFMNWIITNILRRWSIIHGVIRNILCNNWTRAYYDILSYRYIVKNGGTYPYKSVRTNTALSRNIGSRWNRYKIMKGTMMTDTWITINRHEIVKGCIRTNDTIVIDKTPVSHRINMRYYNIVRNGIHVLGWNDLVVL